jgi:class 3 adenylate cyclase
MDSQNRTFVCSVLFLDIAGYSRRSVAEQMALKQHFNRLLGNALHRVAGDDRIVLDTGDGAAVTFLGNPEDALLVAMDLRDAMPGNGTTEAARVPVLRLGINLGPVRLIRDLNAQLNIIGDGINVAQRIMSFAEAGRILVSRSYYEVVSRIDPQFARLFNYEGSRTDKHVREHDVYAVEPGALRWSAQLAGEAQAGRARYPAPPLRAALRARPPGRRLRVALPVSAAVLIALGAAARFAPGPVANSTDADAGMEAVPLLAATGAAIGRNGASSSGRSSRTPAHSLSTVSVDAPADSADSPAGGRAAAKLLVVPWGEVLIDGASRGVTPPLRMVDLAPGRHRIEIRNTSFPIHTQVITVRPGQKVTIRHRFE